MDLKQLDYFVQVAELGSFTRAATQLSVVQSALSRQVRALEVELRQPLFERTGRGVTLTEAGTQHRAQIHILHAPPETTGLEPLEASAEAFAAVLKAENHTLKRALTDPRLFSGIGNAYSDEILHRARLSPIAMTQKLDDAQVWRVLGAGVGGGLSIGPGTLGSFGSRAVRP